jgi:hypothetical protein
VNSRAATIAAVVVGGGLALRLGFAYLYAKGAA